MRQSLFYKKLVHLTENHSFSQLSKWRRLLFQYASAYDSTDWNDNFPETPQMAGQIAKPKMKLESNTN